MCCIDLFAAFVVLSVAVAPKILHRRPPTGQYSCAACNGAGFVDETRHCEVNETRGPLFVSAAQTLQVERATSPSYVFTVTSNADYVWDAAAWMIGSLENKRQRRGK